MRGETVEVRCVSCQAIFTARVADRARGWAKCCSKSCAAKRRERTGTPSKAQLKQRERYARGEAAGSGRADYDCSQCGEPARKYLGAGQIEYLCEHHAALWEHPFSSDALGQS